MTFPVSQADVLVAENRGPTDIRDIKVKLKFSDGSMRSNTGRDRDAGDGRAAAVLSTPKVTLAAR